MQQGNIDMRQYINPGISKLEHKGMKIFSEKCLSLHAELLSGTRDRAPVWDRLLAGALNK